MQDEVIYLNFSTRHIAGLGVDQQAVLKSLQAQNAVAPSGVVQAGPEQVSLRVSGQFNSEESLRAVNLRVNDRFFRLTDIATITRGYRRSAAADVPLQRPAGDRHRHRHEAQQQPPRSSARNCASACGRS